MGQDARTGDSGLARLGSHLARADGVDAVAGQDARTGSSGFCKIGSHQARADDADAAVGQDARTGDSGFARLGSHRKGRTVQAQFWKSIYNDFKTVNYDYFFIPHLRQIQRRSHVQR